MPEIVLRMVPLAPGSTGEAAGAGVRITPGYDGELQGLLDDAGLYRGRLTEESAEVTLATLVTLIGGGARVGAGLAGMKALTPVIQTWLTRHQNTRVELHEDGSIKSVSGTSLEKAQKLIENTRTHLEAMERRLAQQRRLQPPSDVETGDQGPVEHDGAAPQG